MKMFGVAGGGALMVCAEGAPGERGFFPRG